VLRPVVQRAEYYSVFSLEKVSIPKEYQPYTASIAHPWCYMCIDKPYSIKPILKGLQKADIATLF
jgi:hypothetical protein